MFEVGAGTSLLAHKDILRCNAPGLAVLCTDSNLVRLEGITHCAFSQLLKFVYREKVDLCDSIISKDVIAASKRFQMRDLCTLAETCYLNNSDVSFDNVLEDLDFALENGCALLAKRATDFILNHWFWFCSFELSLDANIRRSLKEIFGAAGKHLLRVKV